MANLRPQPTALEIEQGRHAHHAIVESVNALIEDKFPATIIMAGLAGASADLITRAVGVDQVPKWFAEQALATQAMLDEA